MTATTAEALGSAPPPVAPGGGRARRRWGRLVAAVVGAVALVALAVLGLSQLGGGRAPGSTTVDASVDPDGLRAFVLLLESFDADVAVGPASLLVPEDQGGLGREPVDAVLWLADVSPSDEDIDRLQEYVADGGTVVEELGDVGRLGRAGLPGDAQVALRGCDLPALRDVAEVVTWVGDAPAALYGDEEVACFEGEDGPLLTAAADGDGTWITLGTVRPFTNRLLAEADDAVLATSLFAPRPGRRVLLLTGESGLPTGVGGGDPGQGGTGDDGFGGDPGPGDPTDPGDEGGDEGPDEPSLADQVPTGVSLALLQVLLAGTLYALWRGRRVGRPLVEPQPVAVAASELTRAVGGLLARTGDPGRAAALLRQDAGRRLATRLGLPPQAGPEVVAEAAAARAGRDPVQVHRALAGPDPTDEDGLLRLAVELDALCQEVAHDVPV